MNPNNSMSIKASTNSSKWTVSIALGMTAMLAASSSSLAESKGKNGTTLAASKTLEICVVKDSDPTTWRHFGEIAVWNEGAVETEGLTISDLIEQKQPSGNLWNLLCENATITPQPITIPPGTTQQTALVFKYLCEAPAGTLTEDVRNTAKVKITNHSGQIGKPFGPEPKATVLAAELPSLPFCDEGGDGCVHTIGYWGTHHDAWPAGYSPDNPFFTSGYTWGELLPPSNEGDNSNGYIQLARQYIAATLNLASDASMPSGLETDTYNPATNYFNTTTVTAEEACPNPSNCGTQKTWASQLDTYNNGNYPDGPAHCSD